MAEMNKAQLITTSLIDKPPVDALAASQSTTRGHMRQITPCRLNSRFIFLTAARPAYAITEVINVFTWCASFIVTRIQARESRISAKENV